MEPKFRNHRRRSIRLKDYDYTRAGAYFVTICAYNREWIFGRIRNSKMMLNRFGEVVHEEWFKSSGIRREIEMDEFVIMPNHIHGIIVIVRDCGVTARRDRY